MANTNQNAFDFNSYNNIKKQMPTGLKLHLAIGLIKEVRSSLDFFDNPLSEDDRLVDSLKQLREFQETYKEKGKAAAAEKAARIDNSTIPTLGQADMQAQMAELVRMVQFLREGNLAAAQNAEKGIKEIGDGTLHAVGDPAPAAGTGTNG